MYRQMEHFADCDSDHIGIAGDARHSIFSLNGVTNMEFKRTRAGIYESDNGMRIERHYYGGEKWWYVYTGNAVLGKSHCLIGAKKRAEMFVEKNGVTE